MKYEENEKVLNSKAGACYKSKGHTGFFCCSQLKVSCKMQSADEQTSGSNCVKDFFFFGTHFRGRGSVFGLKARKAGQIKERTKTANKKKEKNEKLNNRSYAAHAAPMYVCMCICQK